MQDVVMAAKRVIPLSLAALLLGCSGQYHRELWLPPADTAKASADWDVASATCDGEALATRLSEAERSRMYSEALGNGKGNDAGAEVSEGFAAALMFIRMYRISTAEERKRQRVFVACMQRLGWQRRPNALGIGFSRSSE